MIKSIFLSLITAVVIFLTGPYVEDTTGSESEESLLLGDTRRRMGERRVHYSLRQEGVNGGGRCHS